MIEMSDNGIFACGFNLGIIVTTIILIFFFPKMIDMCGLERRIQQKHISTCVELCQSVGGFEHFGGISGECYCQHGRFKIPEDWNIK